MTLGQTHRRLVAVMMAVAIFIVGGPMLPASAAVGCEHMAMSVSMATGMHMEMKSTSADSHRVPAKPGYPCKDGMNCLGSAGCCTLGSDQVAVALVPDFGRTRTRWAVQSEGPHIAHKPALPPPILQG